MELQLEAIPLPEKVVITNISTPFDTHSTTQEAFFCSCLLEIINKPKIVYRIQCMPETKPVIRNKSPSEAVLKYWCQRHRIFTKFDLGIKMCEESFYSATPELIAMHQAKRILAALYNYDKTNERPLPNKDNPYHDRINFVCADGFTWAQNLITQRTTDRLFTHDKCKGRPIFDAAFTSSPWGGPDYKVSGNSFTLNHIQFKEIKKMDVKDFMNMCCLLSTLTNGAVCLFLPKNTSVPDLTKKALNMYKSANKRPRPPMQMDVELDLLCGKVKGLSAYFGRLALFDPVENQNDLALHKHF
ncbi:hypothetical protein Ciccas_006581 [Cichlidogyrus casuarinus]|uniref:Trimethylguanosine synthase n=1 Tax=Cichlidogyrus casuarinus TaxID=1844966 RepID=A0ABD2Q5C9_9PLAT